MSTCSEGEQGDVTSRCELTLGHCGINTVSFQDLAWERASGERPFIDNSTTPTGWDGEGTMTRVDEDEASYVDDGGTQVTFRLAAQVTNGPCM